MLRLNSADNVVSFIQSRLGLNVEPSCFRISHRDVAAINLLNFVFDLSLMAM